MLTTKRSRIKTEYYARGKLLLTGEYAILHGAKGLALPTRLGQKMEIRRTRGSDLVWESLDPQGESWFEAQISLYDFSPISTTDENVADKLKKLLKNAVRLNSEFLSKWNGFKVETQLEFEKEWGLGSSSTLIHLLAQWADINPFHLYFKVEDGSAYDVACAGADAPISYVLTEDSLNYQEIDFEPKFADSLYFVYLNRKSDSAEAVSSHGKKFKAPKLVNQISEITDQIIKTKSLASFEKLIQDHESLIANVLGKVPIKEELFSDYFGSIKSLGAWGGDFLLATSKKGQEETKNYFEGKGFNTIFRYNELILD